MTLASRLRLVPDECDDGLREDGVPGGGNDSGGGITCGCDEFDIVRN